MNHENSALTEQQKKTKKFFLLLPFLVLPFLTLLLWSVGILGGEETRDVTKSGLNTQLPDAKLKENKDWNKLSFYEQADKDSLKYKDELKGDPSSKRNNDTLSDISRFSYNPLPNNPQDPNELKLNQKLAQLNATLNTQAPGSPYQKDYQNRQQKNPSIKTEDVNRLSQMIQAVNQSDSDKDPETEQLNGMMDKILDIQHPERVKQRIEQESFRNKKAAYAVTLHKEENFISLLGNTNGKKKLGKKENTFFSLGDTISSTETENAIKTSVHETQIVTDGSLLKLMLQDDIYVDGNLIPNGTFIYALVSFAEQRVNLTISAIHYESQILPVELQVFDIDGLEGIHVPVSCTRDVAKRSGTDAISNLGISSLDPSLGIQAANAGIAATKALINNKVKTIKVTIPAGYQVLLKSKLEN